MKPRSSKTQLQELFAHGGFELCKWKVSEAAILSALPSHLLDRQPCQEITDANAFAKALGVEWNADLDSFCPVVNTFLSKEVLTT